MTTHRRTITSVIVALAVGASAGPAVAMPIDVTANGSEVPAGTAAVTQPTHVSQPARVVSQNLCGDACDGYAFIGTQPSAAPQGSGFDWGDAGIGAAGGLTLSLLGIGGIMAVSHRRTRHSESALSS